MVQLIASFGKFLLIIPKGTDFLDLFGGPWPPNGRGHGPETRTGNIGIWGAPFAAVTAIAALPVSEKKRRRDELSAPARGERSDRPPKENVRLVGDRAPHVSLKSRPDPLVNFGAVALQNQLQFTTRHIGVFQLRPKSDFYYFSTLSVFEVGVLAHGLKTET